MDLKPVFLLLSGCEHDIVKNLRASDAQSDVVSKHADRAQKWLHKVYGNSSLPSLPEKDVEGKEQSNTNAVRRVQPPESGQTRARRVLKSPSTPARDRSQSPLPHLRTSKSPLNWSREHEQGLSFRASSRKEDPKSQYRRRYSNERRYDYF